MKFSILPLILGASLLTVSVSAQQFKTVPAPSLEPSVVATFAMPQSVDPGVLTFTVANYLYTHADGTSPGDDAGSRLTGQLIASNGTGAGGGVELHGLIPGGTSYEPVTTVDIFTTYTGELEVDSLVPATFTFPNAWDVNTLTPVTGYAQGFRFTMVPGSAYMNLKQYYALFDALLFDSSDPDGFLTSDFAIRANPTQSTPEPGNIALLGSMLTGGGLLLMRRKKSLISRRGNESR